jgi:hypothetical protein
LFRLEEDQNLVNSSINKEDTPSMVKLYRHALQKRASGSLPTFKNSCPEFIRHEQWLMRSLLASGKASLS